jgi:hypothetical protein
MAKVNHNPAFQFLDLKVGDNVRVYASGALARAREGARLGRIRRFNKAGRPVIELVNSKDSRITVADRVVIVEGWTDKCIHPGPFEELQGAAFCAICKERVPLSLVNLREASQDAILEGGSPEMPLDTLKELDEDSRANQGLQTTADENQDRGQTFLDRLLWQIELKNAASEFAAEKRGGKNSISLSPQDWERLYGMLTQIQIILNAFERMEII